MKKIKKAHNPWLETVLLTTTLLFATPQINQAHVGHGDEFQATGGIEKVEVKPGTDELLGIMVTPINKAAPNGVGVMIPINSLVDTDGKQLVFVQYKNYYEPVKVTTGITQGEYIQVTKELSVGEKLVTQGSLSLYAESRKTKKTEERANSAHKTNAKAEAQVTPRSYDEQGNMKPDLTEQSKSKGISIGTLVAFGTGGAVLFGGLAFLSSNGKRKSRLSK